MGFFVSVYLFLVIPALVIFLYRWYVQQREEHLAVFHFDDMYRLYQLGLMETRYIKYPLKIHQNY